MEDVRGDKELIERCVSGSDDAAWEEFVRQYGRLVWSGVHRTFRAASFSFAPEDAEDLFSSIFLSLVENDFESLRQFQGRNACTLSTWLTVVAAHRTIDFMRRSGNRRQVSLDDPVSAWSETLSDGRDSMEAVLCNRQLHASLHSSLTSLSSDDRQVFELLYQKGLSPESAARTLGISIGAVYTRKHRLIERLKKDIQGV